MFINKNFIYIQLQKTACTHIADLLSTLYDGEQVGKHNAASEEQKSNTEFFFSSIRNPWEWYLSLWTFGVQGGGGLRSRLLRSSVETGGNWRTVYSPEMKVELFRKWLRMIHDPKFASDLGEGYSETALFRQYGFFTYRYLKLCVSNGDKLNITDYFSDFDQLFKHDRENCYIDQFVRQENLEESLCTVLNTVSPLNKKQVNIIHGAMKKNMSKRNRSINEYYDEETIELVRLREIFIIEKFNYSFPC